MSVTLHGRTAWVHTIAGDHLAVAVPALNGGRLWLYDATSLPIKDDGVIAALERAVRAHH